MITKEEIESKSDEFGIHATNVERDYVFGWLLCGIYTVSGLKDILILKGGNALRKAFFANTRFSNDLDFSTETAIDEVWLRQELDRVCDFVETASGVIFEKDRSRIEEKQTADRDVKSYQVRIYFKDFYGNPETITISVRLDIRQFDRLYLPTQVRNLIHPYSDADDCSAQLRCVKLEEMLASKLKCLLQRRYTFDLYDYVYAIFINNELAVNRTEIVSTFLRKTIFERSPGVVRNLLLGLPVQIFKAAWNEYIVCPRQSIIDFDLAIERFTANIRELFEEYVSPYVERLFFSAEMRNLILEAGSGMRLMAITYDGITRTVEPYSLVYKGRRDGHAEEYFYVWDRTGGRSGPGIKAFVNTKIQGINLLDEKFEPRFTVELAKAGEPARSGYFARSSFGGQPGRTGSRSRSSRVYHGVVYMIECPYCGKRFKRRQYTTRLNEHQDRYGNRCYGRAGHLVDQTYG
jgi:predicted nucleotidyltransferase component of viral defense system